ncbi:MAG: response regulator [Planctomycetaceae bacterium]|nr:MAG: response regulator [Planctomycetaceae bacterium]
MLGEIQTKPMEILLVEDGLLDAKVTIHALRRSLVHHRLTLVRTRAEAISFLNREGIFGRAPAPDLLLLDLCLPDGDGLDIVRQMRNFPDRRAGIPVVVLTASDDEETRQRCASLAVDDFISKPVDEEQFLRVVREHKRLLMFSHSPLAVV